MLTNPSTFQGWQEVSKDFGEPVSECKKKWRHLRSSLSRYLKSSRDELKNKNNKLKPYYLLTHMNFLVPYTKTLDTKGDSVGNKSFDETQFDDIKTDEEPSSYEHEIMQDEESDVVYEAYEISEPIQTSSSSGQNKQQITLVRSTTATSNPTVQQIAVNQITTTPQQQQKHQTQIHQLNTSQIGHQLQAQTATATSAQPMPVQNTLIPISEDQTADLNFFLALLPDIKTMNQEQKRVFRLGALKLIDEILTGNR